MSICEKTFNGNPIIHDFRLEIIELLNRTIFYDSKCQLCKRYREMELYCAAPGYYYDSVNKKMTDKFEKQYSQNQITLQSVFTSSNNLWKENNLGHDLPVWINAGDKDNKSLFGDIAVGQGKLADGIFGAISKLCNNQSLSVRTVMLVGIDPMRKDCGPNIISLSSPWGIHSTEYRTNKCKIDHSKSPKSFPALCVWKLISQFNSNGCNVYITDRNKLYATEDTTGKNKIDMSTFKKSTTGPSIMVGCLCEEIKLVQPDIIIFIGEGVQTFLTSDFFKNAYDMFSFGSKKPCFFHIPHPAHNQWKNAIVTRINSASFSPNLSVNVDMVQV